MIGLLDYVTLPRRYYSWLRALYLAFSPLYLWHRRFALSGYSIID